MSSGVTLTAATRQNLLSLQGTADLLSSTQNRLSTGKKVNSALDSPVNFFTSQALNNRSSDLGGLLDGISNGVQTIQAANQGITSIQKLVDSAKSTASQALSVKATASGSSATAANFTAAVSIKGATTSAADGTIDFSVSTDNAAFKVTDANGKATTVKVDGAALAGKVADLGKVTADEILASINSQLSDAGGDGAQVTASLTTDGRLNLTSTATGSDAKFTIEDVAGNTKNIGFGAGTFTDIAVVGVDATDGSTKAKVSGAATTALAAVLNTTNGTGVAGADATLTLKLGDGPTKTLNFAGATLQGDELETQANNAIKGDLGLAGKVVAKFDTVSNQLTFKATTSGSETLTVKSIGTADVGFGTGLAATPSAGVTNTGTGATAGNASNQRSALAQQFNDIRDQITQLAKDSSYNGVNLLYRSGTDVKENTLHISFNENDTSSLDIKGTKFDAAGLGISEVSGSFTSDEDIKAAISQLTVASSTLRTQSSTFGSNLTVVQNRQDFSKNLINILDTGSSNLTNADLNEEAANSQALSTRQSIGISALSLANQANQGILQLLR